MVKTEILGSFRKHAVVIYHLLDDARNDARALVERDEVVGKVEAAVRRLVDDQPVSVGSPTS